MAEDGGEGVLSTPSTPKGNVIVGESDNGDEDVGESHAGLDRSNLNESWTASDLNQDSPNIPNSNRQPPMIKTKPSPLKSPAYRSADSITVKSPKKEEDNPIKLQSIRPKATYTPAKDKDEVEQEQSTPQGDKQSKKLFNKEDVKILKKIEAGINAKIQREVCKMKRERKKSFASPKRDKSIEDKGGREPTTLSKGNSVAVMQSNQDEAQIHQVTKEDVVNPFDSLSNEDDSNSDFFKSSDSKEEVEFDSNIDKEIKEMQIHAYQKEPPILCCVCSNLIAFNSQMQVETPTCSIYDSIDSKNIYLEVINSDGSRKTDTFEKWGELAKIWCIKCRYVIGLKFVRLVIPGNFLI